MPPQSVTLIDRVERRIEGIVRSMVTTFVADIPIYSRLPSEQLAGEISEIVRENLRIFFRCVRERRAPTDDELAEPRASAARRAEERVPLDAVLTAYHVGARMGWKAVVAEARPDEASEAMAIADLVLSFTQSVTGAVAAAYVEEQQHIYGEERDARRALAEALLAGQDPDAPDSPVPALARRAAQHLATCYVVIALAVGTSPDERDEGVVGAVAARRKARRVQQALDALAGEPVLAVLEPEGGAVLFPAVGGEAQRALAEAAEVVDAVAKAAEAEVVAGLAYRDRLAGLREAGAEARDVLELAISLGRGPGAYRLDDVLLEHAVTRPAATAARLHAVLDPLQGRADLIETLERWFAADFDRRRAAAALNVHPNTLDYRLRRIVELTGLDPATARGVQLLGAALVAHRLAHRMV